MGIHNHPSIIMPSQSAQPPISSPSESPTMGQQPSESISQAARNVAAALVDTGCWLLAFDMDQRLVNAHSHGKLRRDELNDYLAKVTPSFVALATAIHEQNESGEAMHKIHLAIATHSDALEHTDLTPPEIPHFFTYSRKIVEAGASPET